MTAIQRLFLAILLGFALLGCDEKEAPVTELKHYPLDNLDGIISQTNLEIDREISADGNGCLRVHATEPTTVRLYETGDLDVENSQLVYQARLRSEALDGQAYLEMWCNFPGMGEYFSRALHSPLSGSNDWVWQATTFLLKPGENPDNIKLNLVMNGSGTVWIDDISLLQGSLP